MTTDRALVAVATTLAILMSALALSQTMGGSSTTSAAAATTPGSAFKDKVRAALLEDPQMLRDAIEELQRQEYEAENQRAQAKVDENLHLIDKTPGVFLAGNKDAELTVVEFFDYHCSYCKAALPTMLDLIENEPNLRFRFVEFPILSEDSVTAAKAAIAADEQGKYLEMHLAMMEAEGRLNEERVLAIAEEVGLDMAKLKTDMNSAETEKVLDAHLSLGEKLGVQGTPGFIVGDKAVPGLDEAMIRDLIENHKHGADKKG